ncbi:MAG TPA: DUF2334 domain-containing protein [Opitutaceae bacterium]|nr:DUF2334 domain-containing protein [Opitutaceae bacterium]
MRYVILRDDDTNALTPVACLERLYRPFLARGLPVNLATIPEVRSDARTPDGQREGFLLGADGTEPPTVPMTSNAGLVAYLRANPGFHVVQHGCFHDPFEFDSRDRTEIVRRLDHGRRVLASAGLEAAPAFVAPHDKFSPVAYREVARRFPVISSGWFEWRRLPPAWWPRYALRKLFRQPHWRVGRTTLLSHPGCILSYHRRPEDILPQIKATIAQRRVTVLVTHWWEYFRDGRPDEAFIAVLHATAEYLASHPDIAVTTFGRLTEAVPAATSAPFAEPLVT